MASCDVRKQGHHRLLPQWPFPGRCHQCYGAQISERLGIPPGLRRAPQVVQWERSRLPMQQTPVTLFPSVGQEDSLEEEMATHSSILAWEIPWTEEPGELQSMEWQRVGLN